MSPATAPDNDRFVMGPAGLDRLITILVELGYQVLGPTVHHEAIVIEPLTGATDLPRGWGDAQDGGTYRLVRRDDDAFFAFAAPAGTWKRYLFPPRSVLFRSRRDGDAMTIEDDPGDDSRDTVQRALLGIRGCDLSAIAIQDKVLLDRKIPDPIYAARRENLFLVGVDCSDPASTCFCTSMDTGPQAGSGADLVLTELDAGVPNRHRFLVTITTERGRAVASRLTSMESAQSAETGEATRSTEAAESETPTRAAETLGIAIPAEAGDAEIFRQATIADLAAAGHVADSARSTIRRHMDTTGLPQLLRDSPDHPQWGDVAERCLSCGNCTMACPTCFCVDIGDESDLVSGADERVRSWSSCFELSHSYMHGGSVRVSTKSRYRQWMTHKLSSWWDQFGTSGCVGCGRCIAWCPVGIDITEEVRAIQHDPLWESAASTVPRHPAEVSTYVPASETTTDSLPSGRGERGLDSGRDPEVPGSVGSRRTRGSGRN